MSYKVIEAETFDKNIFTVFNKDWAIVSAAKTDGSANGMTVSWGGAGTIWNKPAATVYIRQTRYTKEFVDEAQYFSVSFPNPEECRAAMTVMGRTSGRDEDKMAKAGLTWDHEGEVPFIAGSEMVLIVKKLCTQDIDMQNIDPAVVQAQYTGAMEGNFHTMYIGSIEKILIKE